MGEGERQATAAAEGDGGSEGNGGNLPAGTQGWPECGYCNCAAQHRWLGLGLQLHSLVACGSAHLFQLMLHPSTCTCTYMVCRILSVQVPPGAVCFFFGKRELYFAVHKL